MADADFDDFDAYDTYEPTRAETLPAGERFQKLINGAGAVTSVALIAGLIYWGYALAMRDVNGVPVIRALE
ncbi:MAG: SPOR domain-containing protein, partial [Albidovulum sp.]